MGKKIVVAPNVIVIFDERAKGEETPYWVGRILDVSTKKSGVKVADFDNCGQGGPTNFHGADHPVMVELTNRTKAYFEHYGLEAPLEIEDIVVCYAEMIGYELKCDCTAFTFDEYMDLNWATWDCDISDRQPTAYQKQRKETADAKAEDILLLAKAKRVAKKGGTIVVVNGERDHYHQFKIRDPERIRAILARKGVEGTINILA